jgi:hypothetical protein
VSRRTKLLSGIVLALASFVSLALPLAVLLVPFLARYYTIGVSADLRGMQFLAATGIVGGAGLVGAIWLIASGRKKI